MQFEDIQASNVEIETACREKEEKIKAADRSSKGMGAKHIKKLVEKAFNAHMKAYLDRWRNKNNYSICIWLVSAQPGPRLGSGIKSATTRNGWPGPVLL